MEKDVIYLQLHDRATRGERLTETEQEQLAAWYAWQDAEETALLGAAGAASDTTLHALRAEVEEAAGRLLATTQRIHALTEENDALHRDIAALSQRLARTVVSQAV